MSRIRARSAAFGGTGTVAGLVLAGGRGRRVGGADKGLLRDRGKPFAERTAAALAPWCDVLVISANRNRARYRLLADVVVADCEPSFRGPLAGVAAGLEAVRAPWWLVCPCDVTHLPRDVPLRLLRALRLSGGAEVAVLHDAERLQPLVMALRGHLADSIHDYVADGGRSAHGWLERRRLAVVHSAGVLGNRNVLHAPRPARP